MNRKSKPLQKNVISELFIYMSFIFYNLQNLLSSLKNKKKIEGERKFHL